MLIHETFSLLKPFVVKGKQNGVHLVPALVKRMLDKGMFLFGYMNLLGVMAVRSRSRA